MAQPVTEHQKAILRAKQIALRKQQQEEEMELIQRLPESRLTEYQRGMLKFHRFKEQVFERERKRRLRRQEERRERHRLRREQRHLQARNLPNQAIPEAKRAAENDTSEDDVEVQAPVRKVRFRRIHHPRRAIARLAVAEIEPENTSPLTPPPSGGEQP